MSFNATQDSATQEDRLMRFCSFGGSRLSGFSLPLSHTETQLYYMDLLQNPTNNGCALP